MSTNDEATVIQPDDHKRSYGRGGAGNMRLPSVVAAAQDEPELAKEAVNGRRRTSSIRSTKSNSSSSSLDGKARSWRNCYGEGRRMRRVGKRRKAIVGRVSKYRTESVIVTVW
ncbi:hypothetical protein KC323_g2952 [Hortaea werneckii]|nr:hypothetical protein KC323_g2952 [Hortaea werneckii]